MLCWVVLCCVVFSNYWMRLSRIWRILQIKVGVIHRGRRPRWITPSEICRILHILRKPNSMIALLFIQNISPFLKEFRNFALCFSAHQTWQPSPQVFSVNGSIICSGLHFWPCWRHFDVMGSIICSGLHFWRHWFNIWGAFHYSLRRRACAGNVSFRISLRWLIHIINSVQW